MITDRATSSAGWSPPRESADLAKMLIAQTANRPQAEHRPRHAHPARRSRLVDGIEDRRRVADRPGRGQEVPLSPEDWQRQPATLINLAGFAGGELIQRCEELSPHLGHLTGRAELGAQLLDLRLQVLDPLVPRVSLARGRSTSATTTPQGCDDRPHRVRHPEVHPRFDALAHRAMH